VNWSEVLRQRIREVVRQHLRQNRVKALLMTQELSRKAPEGYDSTETIRFWREHRYAQGRS
jgi:hypothetical protein